MFLIDLLEYENYLNNNIIIKNISSKIQFPVDIELNNINNDVISILGTLKNSSTRKLIAREKEHLHHPP